MADETQFNQELNNATVAESIPQPEITRERIQSIIQSNFLDLTKEQGEYAYSKGMLTPEQAHDHADYLTNPVNYHFRDAFRGVGRGVRNAADELMQTGQSLYKWATGSEFQSVHLPEMVQKPNTAIGGLTEGLSQFATAFIPYMGMAGKVAKVGKLATLAEASPKIAEFVKMTVAGMATDATAFDPYQGGLSNFIQDNPSLSNPITEFLKADPSRPEGFARLTKAIEGAITGTAAEGLLLALRFTKAKLWGVNRQDPAAVAEAVGKDFIGPVKPTPITLDADGKLAFKNRDIAVEGRVVDGEFVITSAVKDAESTNKKTLGTALEDILTQLADQGHEIKSIRGEGSQAFTKAILDKYGDAVGVTQGLNDAQRKVEVNMLKVPGKYGHTVADMVSKPVEMPVFEMDEKELYTRAAKVVLGDEGIDKALIQRTVNIQNINAPEQAVRLIQETGRATEVEAQVMKQNAVVSDEAQKVAANTFLRKTLDLPAQLAKDWFMMKDGTRFSARVLGYKSVITNLFESWQQEIKDALASRDITAGLKAMESGAILGKALYMFKGIENEVGLSLRAIGINTKGMRNAWENLTPDALKSLMDTEGSSIWGKLERIANVTDPAVLARLARGESEHKFLSGLLEFRQSALLANPGTNVVNIAGNGLALTMSKLERSTALGWESARHLDPAIAKEVVADLYGATRGIIEAIRLPFNIVKKTKETWEQIEQQQGFAMKVRAAKKTFLDDPEFGTFWKSLMTGDSFMDPAGAMQGELRNAAIPTYLGGPVWRLAFRLPTAMDELFKSIAYHSELHALSYREMRMHSPATGALEFLHKMGTNPSEQIRLQALQKMQELTFSSPLGPMASAIGRAMNSDTRLGLTTKIMFFPFYKIAVNLAKFGIDRTPLLAMTTKRFKEDVAAGGIRRAEAFTRMGTGSALLGLGATLYAAGRITGAAPKDQAQAWINAGIPEYAYKWRDTGNNERDWIRFNRLDPLAMFLGISADVVGTIERRMVSEDKQEDLITAATMILSNNLASKTYMRSMSEMMDVLFRSDRMNLDKWGRNHIASYFPFASGFDALQRERDPLMREPVDAWDAFITQHISPEDLPARRHNVYGTPVERHERTLTAFDKYHESNDPVLQEMLKVGANVGAPTEHTRIANQPIKYTSAQFQRLNDIISTLPMRESLEKQINHPGYKQIDDSEAGKELKSRILKRTVENIRSTAKRILMKEDQTITNEVKQKLLKQADAIRGIHTVAQPKAQLEEWNTLRLNEVD
jgi:hypothetical protein